MAAMIAPLTNAPLLGRSRTSTEKVAILLAALQSDLAVDLLKKLEADDVKQILESSAKLGPLTSGDVEPLVDEFAGEFASALGISASPKQLMALLEAAFTTDQIASFLGTAPPPSSGFSWARFTPAMVSSLVPYLLDENQQTAAYILSRVNADIAARCLEQLPTSVRVGVTARMLHLGDVPRAVQELLEQAIAEDMFTTKTETSDTGKLDKLAAVINRLDRSQSQELLDDLIRESPEDGKKLRKLIFMFEDVVNLQSQHRAKLLDRVSTELIISALFGMDKEFQEVILQSLSARTRRMVESELPPEGAPPRKDTPDARRRIAEAAIQAAKNGDIELPDPDKPESEAVEGDAKAAA
ncbi:MAG: flagellar motor switch protein FliG [Proteobacteria bacterium]|nr:flagellar motor switch protein FliG [Pseudomonadota bacterium]